MKFDRLRRHSLFFVSVTAVLIGLILVAGCNSNSSKLSFKILHINDVHSHLDTDNIDLMLAGEETSCEIGGMARIAAKIAELSGSGESSLVLHAGDAVQGSLYYTLFQGQADADVMNAIGFDAMAIGNHEFDDGDDWLAGFIGMLDAPVISANIQVEAGNSLEGLFQPYIIKTIGGHKILKVG